MGGLNDKPRGRLALAGAVAMAAALALAGTAAAATFKPTRKDDPVPNGCKPHNCSLREAVVTANATPNRTDTILLKGGTYELELGFGDAPAFQSDGLDTFSPVVIQGKGPSETTIDANGIDRPIEIGSGISAPNMNVTMRDLALTGGDAGAATAGNGDSSGGGVVSFAGTLSLNRVLVSGNEAEFGGGIRSFADGGLTIKNSTISGNNADEGGGLDLRSGLDPGESERNRIFASTISGNFARKGAGILIDGNPGAGDPPSLKMLNSTVAGNQASAEGGGVMADNEASVTLDHTTVAYNMANSDNSSPNGGFGGGIVQHGNAAFNLSSSLLAANTVGTGGSNPLCDGTFGSDATTVASPPTITCGITPTFTADALVGPLADNGGPTETVKLLAGSPAIGAAADCPPPNRDQRGKPRPKNCDSGAFERTKP
jgi:Right handed beta helix region